VKPLGICLAYFFDAAFSGNFFSNMRALRQVRLAGTLQEAFRVCDDNFLQERGGQCFWR